MKVEHSGCLTVDDQATTDAAGDAIDQTMRRLEETLEYPFVAVALSVGDQPTAYVFHDDVLGQYVLAQRKDVRHVDEPYWTVQDGQPLSWLVEDLIDAVGSSVAVDVELVDKAVMRARLTDATFERPRYRRRLEATERERENRARALDSMGGVPEFVSELVSERVYSMGELLSQGATGEAGRL
jgi:hypothetical protein